MTINLMAPISELGYGQAGKHYAKQLFKIDKATALWIIGKPEVSEKEDIPIIQHLVNNTANFNHLNPCVRIYHQFSLAERIGKGPFFGFPIFELDRFSKSELTHLSSCDHLIVCSQWAKGIIERNIPSFPANKIHVVHLGYDPKIFGVRFDLIGRSLSGKYIFFNCGKWETRKGHDILCKAFNAAFEQSDKVELWMMPTNPFLSEKETNDWEHEYKNCKLWSKIKILPRVLTQWEVADIMHHTDCGVFPSRGEGWNLEALEMLACGKELIITDYSAHKEFATTGNANLIPITETELAIGREGKERNWFHGQGEWVKFGKDQFDSLVEHMRFCYQQRPTNNATEESLNKLKRFTWEAVTQDLINVTHNQMEVEGY
jgi:glycosyltransferase involved in cell wall biosynthesis